MNPQQLRQIIQLHLQIGLASSTPSADCPSDTALATATRRIADQLQSQRNLVAAPRQPLPSAECLAAFAMQQTTSAEEQQVVASCIHDMGILFQLVNIFDQQLNSLAEPVPADVLARLLALGPKDAKAVREAASVTINPAQPSVTSGNITAHQPMVVHRRADSTNRSHGNAWKWTGTALLATSALIAAFFAGYWISRDPNPNHGQSNLSPPKAPQQPEHSEKEQHEKEPIAIEPPLLELVETPSQSLDSVQMADEKSVPPQPNSESPTLALEPPEPSSNSEIPQLAPMPEHTTAPQFSAPALAATRLGAWKQVIGIVATSPDREYPVWQAVTESNVVTVIDETKLVSWMTPPSCYAQTTFGDRGKFILRENSLASFRMRESNSEVWPVCELEYGAVYIENDLANHQVQIVAASTANLRLVLNENASLVAWVEGRELRLLSHGEVKANGQPLVSGKLVRVENDTLNVVPESVEVPGWCQKLPKENLLSRAILANLDGSEDLAKSVDQQLIRLLSRPSTPQLLNLVQQLSQWRVAMDIDSPLRSAVSPITPVRLAAFSALMSDTAEQRFLVARRSLFARLQLDDARRRLQIVRRRVQPNRQDIATWLNELTGDNSELAALADFMFRSQVAVGPDFDPTAPRAQRELSKREWMKVVTGR